MKEIVVGLDGSPASSSALAHAVSMARRTGGRVRALHAWTTPVWMGGVPGFAYNALASPEDSLRFAKELASRQVGEAEALGVEVVADVAQGPARHVLVEASRHAGLLVVGSHGEGRVQGLLLGSVAMHLLGHAACPLLLVPDSDLKPEPWDKVVVGVDGSESSRAAMRWALHAAREAGCPLVVLHAWMIRSLPMHAKAHFVPSLREYESECQEWLDKELQEALPDREGVDVKTELSYSSPVSGLREAAGPHDVLVVGRCGRGGFPGMLLGSVASQCAHYSQGLMVVVPAVKGTTG